MGKNILVFWVSICIGIMLGYRWAIIIFCYPKSKLSSLIQGYINIIQGTPLYVQMLIVCNCLTIRGIYYRFIIVSSVIGLNSTAYLAKVFINTINNIDTKIQQQFNLLPGSSMSKFKLLVPLIQRSCISNIQNECTALLKETSIISMVGIYEVCAYGKSVSVYMRLGYITPHIITGFLFWICSFIHVYLIVYIIPILIN